MEPPLARRSWRVLVLSRLSMNPVIALAPAALKWLTTRVSGSDSGEVEVPNGASLRCAVPRCQYAVTTQVPASGAVHVR